MPSLSSIMKMTKEERRSTWEKLYRVMIATGVKRIRPEDVKERVRITPGLDFEEGTTISRIINELEKHGYVTIDKNTGELILSDPKEVLEDYRFFAISGHVTT